MSWKNVELLFFSEKNISSDGDVFATGVTSAVHCALSLCNKAVGFIL